ncbi:MAG TPA: glycosyltransferase family 4 protein [Chloroflexota bacterium]|nr:glycosyltransferase family 4 protein [Chloroflexota bacterium]
MRIAQVAPPLESVPPARYGGTERVVATLTEELVRRGHDVTLFASGDSQTSAQLIPLVDKAVWHHRPPYRDFGPFLSLALGRLLREADAREFDVVHSHLDHFGFAAARALHAPTLTTLHGRIDLPELQPVFDEYREVPLVSISNAQRQPIPDANWMATVYHGIDLEDFTFSPQPGRYLAFLGRISSEKGVAAAIRIASAAGMPIRIAARLPLPHLEDPNVRRDWTYYQQEVQPLLQGPDVELIGQVGGRQKDEFLRNAAALLFPISWPEPFGLVMPEALACGTPVLALRAGSVPEIITDGLTGFVRDTEEALVEAVGRIATLDRAACRAEAERRFSATSMTDCYEAVYAQLVNA